MTDISNKIEELKKLKSLVEESLKSLKPDQIAQLTPSLLNLINAVKASVHRQQVVNIDNFIETRNEALAKLYLGDALERAYERGALVAYKGRKIYHEESLQQLKDEQELIKLVCK